MNKEIERKFIIKNNLWNNKEGFDIVQGYLSDKKEAIVRVRIKKDRAYLTIKSATENITRNEFEYEIPYNDAKELLKLCDKKIEKTRYLEKVGEHTFEIDVFRGDNAGLIVAEIELKSEDEEFIKPDWLGKEVSGDARFYNSNLVNYPYKLWKERDVV